MSALNHLPTDLIEEILPFLPSKSLGRFKSVSKRWYSLISSPSFIKTHILNYAKNNHNADPTHLVLLPTYSDDVWLYSLDIKQLNIQTTPATVTVKRLNLQEPWARILGSCNGLLLAKDKHHNLYLVNLTTEKTFEVPNSGGKGKVVAYGFGYDTSTDDYKVISISCMRNLDSDANYTFVYVYSLRNNLWRKLTNSLFQQVEGHTLLRSGVLLNNNLHWVVQNRRSTKTIASFSLDSEEFHEIDLPYSFDNVETMCFALFAFREKLVGVRRDEFGYELWMMEEYGVRKSWTKIYILENDRSMYNVLCTQVSNRDIWFWLGINLENEIVIYNMDEHG